MRSSLRAEADAAQHLAIAVAKDLAAPAIAQPLILHCSGRGVEASNKASA
jgi:hypothetical protein